MTNKFCSYDDLPVTICADDVALVLGISRANAYALMHTKGFDGCIVIQLRWLEVEVALEVFER